MPPKRRGTSANRLYKVMVGNKMNRKRKVTVLMILVVCIFILISAFCFAEGYWTFNPPGMTASQTVERYIQYFNAENTVGANSLHYTFGQEGFYFTYFDLKQYKDNIDCISAVEIGKSDKYIVEPIAKEAVSVSADYTMVKAEVISSGEKKMNWVFILVKKNENSRWRVCWMG